MMIRGSIIAAKLVEKHTQPPKNTFYILHNESDVTVKCFRGKIPASMVL